MLEQLYERIIQNGNSLIYDESQKYTFGEFINKVEASAGEFIKEDKTVKKRAKCCILCGTGINTAQAILACWKAELIPVPMSVNYGQSHVRNIINLISPDIIIVDYKTEDITEQFNICRFNISKNIFVDKPVISVPEEELEEIALILCTSGTTGTPKGVMLTEEGLMKNILGINKYFSIDSNDHILIARPLYHCAVITGEFLVSLYKGTNICFFDGGMSPFKILEFTEKYNISVLCGTPTLFFKLSQICVKRNAKIALKTAAISGECLSYYIARSIRKAFPETDIYNVYGLTEASPRVSYLAPLYFDIYPESVGGGLKDTEIMVIEGYIFVKSPSIMKGYYKDPELTKNVLREGWLYTGDKGYKNKYGFLFIEGRADDMIIKGGMNIYPKEIESRLIGRKEFKEVAVCRKELETGNEISLNIVLNSQFKNLLKKDIVGIVCGALPSYMIPLEINVLDKIPKTQSGKIIRKYISA